jgi:hypothetical protein
MPAGKKSPIGGSVVEELRDKGCTIYYEKSVTKNMGNYESAKVTVGVTLPICPTKSEIAEIEETIEIGDEIVTKELEVQLKELLDAK